MKILDDPMIDYQVRQLKEVMENGGAEGKAAIVTVIALAGFGILGAIGAVLWIVT